MIVLAVVLLIFGSSRLPKLARSLGQAKQELDKGMHEGGHKQAPSECPHCGEKVENRESRFCASCGRQLTPVAVAGSAKA